MTLTGSKLILTFYKNSMLCLLKWFSNFYFHGTTHLLLVFDRKPIQAVYPNMLGDNGEVMNCMPQLHIRISIFLIGGILIEQFKTI